MKTNILHGWKWMLAVSGTVMLMGCLDETSGTNAQTVAEIAEPKATAVATTNILQPEPDALPAQAVIPPANLSPGLKEVVELAQSGVGEDVLTAYVEKSDHAFNPTVDEIVYLKDIGVPDAVVTAMLRHAESANASAQNSNAPAMVANQPASPSIENNLSQPSLTAPAAPSYSVAAETNYNEAPAIAPPPQQVNINYFENTLSPYGSWVDVPDYGRCWQPTVVVINRNWRPYADRGRWLYTSSGWYWQSDYSWGWAPFHYGRWHCDNRIGWVWVPGSTWGPAWVSWRYTDQYCGWAPLPPSAHYVSGFGFRYRGSHVGISFDFGLNDDCYTFIPTSRFCDRSPSHFYVSRSHCKTIYKNSVVINNYVRGKNIFINEGIGRDRITRATHTPVRTVALRELPSASSAEGKAGRLEGNHLTVFRPNVSKLSSIRPTAQRSLTTSATVTPRSTIPARNLSSLTKTVTPKSTTTVDSATPATRTLTRSFAPASVARSSSRFTTTPRQVTPPTTAPQTTQRTIPITRTAPSSVNTFPVQSSPREIDRRIERRSVTVGQREIPRPIERNNSTITRQSTVREAPMVRTAPSVSTVQRPQPSVRETRRQEAPQFNFNPQRSVQSAAPTHTAPVRNFNPPREINREISRIERSAPPRVSQPRPSAPAPTIRESSPRPSSPSPRQRIERSVERSGRSDRNRS